MRFRPALTLAATLVCLGLPPFSAADPSPTAKPREKALERLIPVKDAPDFDGGTEWVNTTRPLHIKDLRGKVVLLDFWTSCCINCIHEMPHIKGIEEHYHDDLIVIGVHSGKFRHEHDDETVKQAALRYGIKHPIVNDPDLKIWNAYGVPGWPSFVFVDANGKIYNMVSGEGHASQIMQTIYKIKWEARDSGVWNGKHFPFLKPISPPDTPLLYPGKITTDTAGARLFISDSDHNRIVIADKTGKVIETIGSGTAGSEDGGFANCQLANPQGLAISGDKLYIADTDNHLIRVADLKTKQVKTLAGTGENKRAPDTGAARSVPLNSPWDLCLIGDQLFIAMAGSHQIWCLNLKSNTIERFAGTGFEAIQDRMRKSAVLAQPSGITTDGKTLYFVDSETSSVRSCDLADRGYVTTLIGSGLFEFGDKDGAFAQAKLQHPIGITWLNGKLYVADSFNNKIKVIDLASKTISTVAGTTAKPGAPTELAEPSGLCGSGDKLYIADTNHSTIKILDLKTKKLTQLKIAPAAPAQKKSQLPELINHLRPVSDQEEAPVKQPVSLPEANGEEILNGLPATSKAPAQNVQVSQLQYAENSKCKLLIEFALPPGYHMNDEAPSNYKILSHSGEGLVPDKAAMSGPINAKKPVITIGCQSGAAGKTSDILIEASVYFCTDDFCKSKKVKIQAKSTAGQSKKTDATITCLVD